MIYNIQYTVVDQNIDTSIIEYHVKITQLITQNHSQGHQKYQKNIKRFVISNQKNIWAMSS